MEQALAHAAKFGVAGVTASLTKGVVKNIIPAIASTQAIIAAMYTTETQKLVTGAGPSIDNNLLCVGDVGMNVHQFRYARDPECGVCSRKLVKVPRVSGETLKQLMDRLKADFDFPATSMSSSGTALYIGFAPQMRANLDKRIAELVEEGGEIIAVAAGRPPFEFVLVGE